MSEANGENGNGAIHPEPATPAPDNGIKRGAGGKFLPGTKGGPGNPHKARMQRRLTILDRILEEVCSEDEIRRTIQTCLTLAIAGDKDARKDFWERYAGKASQDLNVDARIAPGQGAEDQDRVRDLITRMYGPTGAALLPAVPAADDEEAEGGDSERPSDAGTGP